jgi:hypothetical protein
MFGMVGVYKQPDGVLRLDISSEYENDLFLSELLSLCVNEFFPLFAVERIITKAIPAATERIQVLQRLGFRQREIPERPYSWVLDRQ